MIKTVPFFLVILLLSIQTLLAVPFQPPSLKKQLTALNQHWKGKDIAIPASIENVLLENEVALIQMHLSLVEKNLRSKDNKHLSPVQKQKRNECLDILHQYWQSGTFPQNRFHKKRTPYFIDHLGTACAVGQLLVSTGSEDFAKKISKENNYGYIFDLEKEYPTLNQWAEEYGFTLAELAWIQPTYAICDTTCNQTLHVNPIDGTAPYTYLWSTGETTAIASDLCPGTAYSCTVVDALGEVINNLEIYFQASIEIENPFTIPEAEPVIVELSSTTDCNCDGTATVSVFSGYAPFFYTWEDGQSTATASGLCKGSYMVTVYDSQGCGREELATVIPELEIDLSITEDPGNCNGAATVSIMGGTPPYTYSWDSGNQTETATGLCLGDHLVTVSDMNGCSQTKVINIPLLSDVLDIAVENITMFPNPARDRVTIRLNEFNFNNNVLTVYDLSGQVVLQQPVNGAVLELDIDSFANGVYMVSVGAGKGIVSGRFVKMN